MKIFSMTLLSLIIISLLRKIVASMTSAISARFCKIAGYHGHNHANFTYGEYCLLLANCPIEYGRQQGSIVGFGENFINKIKFIKGWCNKANLYYSRKIREPKQKDWLIKALKSFDAVTDNSEDAGKAAYWAGLIHLRGFNVDKNAARNKLEFASSHGVSSALFELALLLTSEGKVNESARALGLYEKAIQDPIPGEMLNRALLEMAKIECSENGTEEPNLHNAQKHLQTMQFPINNILDEKNGINHGAHDLDKNGVISEAQVLLVEVTERIKTEAQRNLAKAEREKREAIENMLAMFAHKFRGAVDSIMFNTEHLHDERLYIDMAQTMNGLLDVFAIVSTNPEAIAGSFREDTNGSGSPIKIFAHSIKLALMQLCSPRDRRRMSQYYLAHAKKQGQVPDNLTLKAWVNDEIWQVMETSLQEQWSIDVGGLIIDTEINSVVAWMNEHLLPLDLTGFMDGEVHFDPHGRKASILTIVFTEIMVNAIKHGVPGSSQAITVSWYEEGGSIVFVSQNPSTKETRSRSRGSGRGHKFLGMLAQHMGGNLEVDVYQDISRACLRFPADLMKGSTQ